VAADRTVIPTSVSPFPDGNFYATALRAHRTYTKIQVQIGARIGTSYFGDSGENAPRKPDGARGSDCIALFRAG